MIQFFSRFFRFVSLFLLASVFGLSTQAQEVKKNVDFEINQAQSRKSVLAFPPMQFLGSQAASPNFNQIGGEFYRVVQNNLTISTFFQFLSHGAFFEDTSKTGLKPVPLDPRGFKFDSWKRTGAEFLIRGGFSITDSTLTLEMYTYSVGKSSLVFGRKYTGTVNDVRKMAHQFSNDFLKELTGTEGPFLSKIVFASDRVGSGFREIYVSDWDTANMEKVTNHKSVALSPAISSDGNKVAYTAFVQRAKSKVRNADLFLYDIRTDKRLLISYRQGINSGAAFTPDNSNLLLTLSQNNTPDIYRINLEGEIIKRITNGPRSTMNVEPAMSPDGTKIAFSSDRSGQPMLYTMNSDGSNVKRLTFAGKYNSTPAWSPDGKKIAFAGWETGNFDVFVMNADGSNMVRVTATKKKNGKDSNNEDPVFSPDGRLLMYTSDRTGSKQLFISNLEGTEEFRITNDNFNYMKPKWSGTVR